jgi:hypothetical protein
MKTHRLFSVVMVALAALALAFLVYGLVAKGAFAGTAIVLAIVITAGLAVTLRVAAFVWRRASK